MNNKRAGLLAGLCLTAALTCVPVQQTLALPQEKEQSTQETTDNTTGITTDTTEAATDTTTEIATDSAITAEVTELPQLTAQTGYNNVTLTWTQVEGATRYRLEYGTSKKEFKKLTQIKAGKPLQYTLTDLYSNKKYYFRVIATVSGEKKTSEILMAKPTLTAPQTLTLTHAGFGEVQLAWDALEGAEEYRIYRSVTSSGGFKRIATVKDAAYTDMVAVDATYYYKVAGVRINPNAKRVRGVVSEAYAITVPTDVVEMKSATAAKAGVTVRWGSVEGAERYAVYRSNKKNSGYKRVTTVTGTSWSDSGVTSGTRYYYKVAAMYTRDGATQYAPRSKALTVWTAPPAPQDLRASQEADGIQLSWSASQGASAYRIYRATSGGEYTMLAGGIKKTNYTDATISADADYTYYVVAVHDGLIGGKSSTVSMHVASITLSTRTLLLGPGVSMTLSETSDLPGEVTFVSKNKSIATVDANGTVTGVAAGSTTVQVKVGAVSANVTVTVTDTPVNGIDVSKWQQAIDWSKVKASGIQFAMLRLAHGGSKDIQFENYYKGATEQDIPVGIYCYTSATSVASGKKEAKNLIEMLDGKDLDFPIALDLEDNTQLTSMNKEQRTKLVLAYKKIIENAGYEFILYANLNWLTNYIDNSVLEDNDVDIWIARYCSQSLGHRYTGGGNVQMWQYSSTGQIDGILDAYGRYINVDLDVYYGDY